jgi:aminocarboxymuconate-semialdehyde decarboxylase
MTGRREFLGAGIAFVGCSLLDAAQAQSGKPAHREVLVSGKRVKTIDVHAHVAIPEAMALMGMKVAPQSLVMGEDRIRAMDEQGIDMAALSINPYWYKAERDVAQAVIKLQNEKLAELCASRPERFVAFASVALQHPDLAAQQLEEGVKKLGLRGAAIGGSVFGEELSDPKFHPFWGRRKSSGAWCSSTRAGSRISTSV